MVTTLKSDTTKPMAYILPAFSGPSTWSLTPLHVTPKQRIRLGWLQVWSFLWRLLSTSWNPGHHTHTLGSAKYSDTAGYLWQSLPNYWDKDGYWYIWALQLFIPLVLVLHSKERSWCYSPGPQSWTPQHHHDPALWCHSFHQPNCWAVHRSCLLRNAWLQWMCACQNLLQLHHFPNTIQCTASHQIPDELD